MTEPADADRLTKPQAAAALGVSERTLDQLVRDGKLDPRRWRPPGGGQWRTVFLAEDVRQLAAERQGSPPAPFLVPSTAGPGNGNGHQGRLPARTGPADLPSGEDVLRLVFAMAQRAWMGGTRPEGPQQGPQAPQGPQEGPQAQQGPHAPTAWIDVPTAAARFGRSVAYVRKLIKAGTLYAERDRCLMVRRKDVEALCDDV